jgi:protein-tyrosine phosphatase
VTDDRWLAWPALLNVRHLGSLPTAAGPTTSGAVVRADDLHRLTEQGLAALRAYGVNTIIDLRAPRELVKLPSPVRHHPGYRPLP